MPYNPRGGGFGNVTNAQTQDRGYSNIFQDMLNGYAGSLAANNLPTEIANKNRMSELQNSLLESQLQKNSEYGGMGGDFTGDAGNAFRLALLEKQLGPDDPRVIAVKEAIALQQEGQRGLIDYRQQLSESAPKRFSTAQGKLLQEMAELNAGFRPGSDYSQPISGDEQEALRGQYELALMNKNTDADTRKRALLASNIDKTIDSFDIKDLTRYAGVAGGLNKKREQGLALSNKESEEYRKFEEALTSVGLLASQIRQFYQESISPDMRKHLEELTNPSTWTNNPTIAERKFNQLRGTLDRETETYRNALKNPREYGKHSSKTNESDPLGLFD